MTALPLWVRRQLTQLVDAAPERARLAPRNQIRWLSHARAAQGGAVKLLTRTGPDWTHKYAGRVGSGINIAEFQRLGRRLQPLATDTMPLAAAQHPLRLATCAEPRALGPPELVAEEKLRCGGQFNLTW
jgi:ATP-dependent DNA ligase